MAENTGTDNLGITTLLEQARASRRKGVVPRQKSKGFVRVKYIKGRPYYYLVRSVRIDGKIKQEVIKYLGTRKPRV